MSSYSALCSHVTRRIHRNERLTGSVLQCALDAIEGARRHEEVERMAQKLIAGEGLDDYESHLMLDMYLVHARLAEAAGAAKR